MIVKILFPSAVTLHRPWLPILISLFSQAFLVLGLSFFTARVFLVEISSLLFYMYMQNIGDCFIRVLIYFASCQALSPGMAQCVIPPYILINMAYFNYVDIIASSSKITPTCFRD